jgi:hypothetical protein
VTNPDLSVGTSADAEPAGNDDRILGTFLGYLTFGALALVVPLMILTTPDVGRSSGWLVTLAILLISAVRLSFLVALGERRLFEFIFWLFSYVFFGLAPTVQIRADQMATTTASLNPALDVPTAALSLGGILASAAGFAWANRKRRAQRPGERVTREIPIHRGRLVLLTLLGVAATGYYLSRVGVSSLLFSRAEFSDIEDQIWPDSSIGAIVSAASAVPILIAAHGWWDVVKRSERTGWARIVASVLTAVSLFVTNPVSSARYHFGVVWASFLAPLGAYSSKRHTSITMLGIIGGLLFLFPIADLFRRRDSVNAVRPGFLAEYEGNGDYDAFGQLSNALLFTETTPLEPGRQLLGILLFWVPRSIWTEKPTGTGVLLAEFRGYGFTNLSAPVWAEMLVNFGIVGVIVLSALLGVMLGRLDRRFRSSSAPGVAEIAAAVLPFYFLIILRGSLLQAMGMLVMILLSLALIADRPKPVPSEIGHDAA